MPNQYKVTKFQNTVTSTAQLFFTATATTTLIKSVLVSCDRTSVMVELYIKKFGSTNTLLKRYTITSGDDSYNMLSDVLPLEDKDELWVSSSDLDAVWLASYVESTTTTTATSVRNLPDWSDSLPTADGQVPTWNVSLGEYQPTTLDVPVDLIDLDGTPSTYGAPGQVLATNSNSNGTEWVTVTQGGGGSVETVNSVSPDQSGNVILDTDDIDEGTTNLYYTNNRVDARVAALDLANQTYVDTQVGNEESARIAADSALQTDIDTNATAITNEASARSSADSNLQSQISSNDGDITALDGRLTTAESDIAALEAITHVNSLNSLTGAVTLSAGSNVTLTQVGNDIEIASSGGGGGGGSDSFNTIVVADQTSIVADHGNDTLTIVAGTGIELTTDAPNDTLTISTDLTTTDVAEGANLYYTDVRVAANSAVVANTAKNSYPTADASKLAGIEAGAEVNPTASEIKTLYESNADTNAFTDAEQTKLTGIEAGAEVNPTASEVKTLYESNTNTNAFTDSEKTKLAGIDAGAQINVNADWDATSGDAEILNKPTLAAVATSGAYGDLSGTPTIPSDLIDLDDTPATYGSAGQVLATNATTDGTEWITISGGGGAVDSVNEQTGEVVLDTDDISEGGTNLYYTDVRVNTFLVSQNIYASYPTSVITGSTLLTLSDAQKMLVCKSVSQMTLTLPTGLGRDTEILVYQEGVGSVTIVPDTGVAILTTSGFLPTTAEQFAIIGLKKIGTADEWVVTGERKLA